MSNEEFYARREKYIGASSALLNVMRMFRII